MPFDWQTIAAVTLVLLAVVYLLRMAWKTFAGKKTGGCGSCSSQPTEGNLGQTKQLFTLDPPPKGPDE